GAPKAPVTVGGDDVNEADAGPELDSDAAPVEDDEDDEEETPDPTKEEGVCGDNICNINETCAACSPDCGLCPVCDLAPTCTGSAAIPSSAKHLDGFDNADQPIYTSGVDEN